MWEHQVGIAESMRPIRRRGSRSSDDEEDDRHDHGGLLLRRCIASAFWRSQLRPSGGTTRILRFVRVLRVVETMIPGDRLEGATRHRTGRAWNFPVPGSPINITCRFCSAALRITSTASFLTDDLVHKFARNLHLGPSTGTPPC